MKRGIISPSSNLLHSFQAYVSFMHRPSSYAVEMMRILERCIKESRAIDTESLCIIAGEKASYLLHADAGFMKVFFLFTGLGDTP